MKTLLVITSIVIIVAGIQSIWIHWRANSEERMRKLDGNYYG